jgi:hypothetical protein
VLSRGQLRTLCGVAVAVVGALGVTACGSGNTKSDDLASDTTGVTTSPIAAAVGQKLTKAQYLSRAAPLCRRLRLLPQRIADEPPAKRSALHDWAFEAKIKTPIAVRLAKLRPPTGDQEILRRLNGLVAARLAYLKRLSNPDYYTHRFSTVSRRRTAYIADFNQINGLDHQINAQSRMYGLPPCAPGP